MNVLTPNALEQIKAKMEEKDVSIHGLAMRLFQKNIYSYQFVRYVLMGKRNINDRFYLLVMRELEGED
jgi:hypothetical protein